MDAHGVADGPFFKAPEGFMNGWRMHEILKKYREVNKIPFPDALMAVSHFHSTDPRDKIYGLLGFASVPLDSMDWTFYPNYDVTNTTASLYTNTARYLLEWEPPMSILQLAGIGFSQQQRIKDLPSWVPDWSSIDKEIKCYGSERRSEFSAGGALFKKPRYLGRDLRLLAIDAMVIDSVARLSKTRPAPLKRNLYDLKESLLSLRSSHRQIHSYKADSFSWFHEVENMVALVSNLNESWKTSNIKSYPHGRTTEPVTWRLALALTMVAGASPLNGEPDDDVYMKLWQDIIALHQEESSPLSVDGTAFIYNSGCNYATNSRRFFTTQGGFIGLTSPGTKVGDSVCLISGAVTPFIMQRNQETWTIVGEAYIHGLMYGQGLDKGKMETFFVE